MNSPVNLLPSATLPLKGTELLYLDQAGTDTSVMAAALGNSTNILAYGADPSLPDNSSFINAAILAMGAAGGGIVDVPAATFNITHTVLFGNGTPTANSTVNNVFLRCAGTASSFSTGINGTRLLWNGAPGGTMMQFAGGGVGGGILGALLLDGGGIAATGLDVVHWNAGTFATWSVRRCTGIYTQLRTQTVPDTLGGIRDNTFGTYMTDTVPAGATGISIDALTSTSDALQNSFGIIDIPMSGTGATGMVLGYADFNYFGIVDLSCQSPLTTSIGILLKGSGPAGNAIFPTLNKFGLLSTTAPVVTNTAGGQPFGNYVEVFDVADSSLIVPAASGIYGYAVSSNVSGTERLTTPFGFRAQGWNQFAPSLASMAFSGAASCVGTLMTVTGATGTLTVGSVFTGSGVPAGDFVTAVLGGGQYTVNQTFAGSPTISATSAQNTLTYPVMAYLSPSTGVGLSGIYLCDQHINAEPLPGLQLQVQIDPGCTISFTGTALAAWTWYGLSA